jgi:hypothetical protein
VTAPSLRRGRDYLLLSGSSLRIEETRGCVKPLRTEPLEVTMKAFLLAITLGAGLNLTAMAQTSFTGTCKDGTSFSGTTRIGACGAHGGVQAWGTASPAATPAPAPATPGKPTTATPVPSGGPGQVWVNTASHVYHCQGTKYYGTTKKGEYMTEAAAKAAGNHADHSKACS